MHTTLMLLAAVATIYLTSVLLGERKDRWFRRRLGQRPAEEARWQDHFQFGPPKTRHGVMVAIVLFLLWVVEAWVILLLFGS